MCKSLDSFLFVVVDTAFENMQKENSRSAHKYKLDYVFFQMREIQAKYSDCCQFVFSGSREHSVRNNPKILILGKNFGAWIYNIFYNQRLLIMAWIEGKQKLKREYKDINQLMETKEGYLDETEAKLLLYKFLRENPSFATQLFTGVKLSVSTYGYKGHDGK